MNRTLNNDASMSQQCHNRSRGRGRIIKLRAPWAFEQFVGFAEKMADQAGQMVDLGQKLGDAEP